MITKNAEELFEELKDEIEKIILYFETEEEQEKTKEEICGFVDIENLSS